MKGESVLRSLFFAVVVCLPVQCFAADFSVPLTDLDGVAIDDGTLAKKPFTLGEAAVRALIASFPDEPNLSAIEKFKRAELASRIHNKTNVMLSAEDTALVKTLIGKAFAPVVVFRAWPLLDPAGVPKP